MRRSIGSRRELVMVVAVWLAPLAVLAIVADVSAAAERSSLRGPAPAWADPGHRRSTFGREVVVDVTTTASTTLYSPVSGRVTAVFVRPGVELSSGFRLFDVDGVGVLAMTGEPAPLYRVLQIGARGADVGELNTFLASAGFGLGRDVGDDYTDATARAVTAMQAAIGAQTDGVFRPAYVAFVPPGVTAFGGIDVHPDQPVAKGASVGESQPAVDHAVVTDAPGVAVVSLEGSKRVRVRSSAGDVVVDDLAPTDPDATRALAAVTAGLEPASTSQLPDGRTRASFAARAEMAEPVAYSTLPGAAVAIGPSGRACVFRRSTRGTTVVRVTPISSPELGVAYVSEPLSGSFAADIGRLPTGVLRRCN